MKNQVHSAKRRCKEVSVKDTVDEELKRSWMYSHNLRLFVDGGAVEYKFP